MGAFSPQDGCVRLINLACSSLLPKNTTYYPLSKKKKKRMCLWMHVHAGDRGPPKVNVALRLPLCLRHSLLLFASARTMVEPFQGFSSFLLPSSCWSSGNTDVFYWILLYMNSDLNSDLPWLHNKCSTHSALFPAICSNSLLCLYYIKQSMSRPCLWSITHINLKWGNSCVYFNHIWLFLQDSPQEVCS